MKFVKTSAINGWMAWRVYPAKVSCVSILTTVVTIEADVCPASSILFAMLVFFCKCPKVEPLSVSACVTCSL